MKKKNKFKVIKWQTILTIILILLLCVVMLFTFYQNITLKLKRNELNAYIEEYQILKEELNKLEEIKENYEIIVADNNDLETKKRN